MPKTGIKKVVENSKIQTNSINKLVKLTKQFIDALTEAEKVIPAKIKYATAGKYAQAAIERDKEFALHAQANKIFKQMKKVRKEIK